MKMYIYDLCTMYRYLHDVLKYRVFDRSRFADSSTSLYFLLNVYNISKPNLSDVCVMCVNVYT